MKDEITSESKEARAERLLEVAKRIIRILEARFFASHGIDDIESHANRVIAEMVVGSASQMAFKTSDEERAFLYRATRNLCLDDLRKEDAFERALRRAVSGTVVAGHEPMAIHETRLWHSAADPSDAKLIGTNTEERGVLSEDNSHSGGRLSGYIADNHPTPTDIMEDREFLDVLDKKVKAVLKSAAAVRRSGSSTDVTLGFLFDETVATEDEKAARLGVSTRTIRRLKETIREVIAELEGSSGLFVEVFEESCRAREGVRERGPIFVEEERPFRHITEAELAGLERMGDDRKPKKPKGFAHLEEVGIRLNAIERERAASYTGPFY